MSPSAHPQQGGGSSSSAPADTGGSRNSVAQTADAGVPVPRTDQELAQAFRDLARGEQAATALEANLTNLESKLDELLASFESPAAGAGGVPPATNGSSAQQDGDDLGGEKQHAPSQPRSGQDAADK